MGKAKGVGRLWGKGPGSHQAPIKGDGERAAQPERIFNDPQILSPHYDSDKVMGLSLADAAKGSPEKFSCLAANLLINIVIYFPLFYPTCVKQAPAKPVTSPGRPEEVGLSLPQSCPLPRPSL